MGHNLNFNEKTGQHAFMSVKEKAWHGLGKIVAGYPNSKEALVFAGLDYKVQKRPLFTYGQDMTIGTAGELAEGKQIPVANFYASVRTDTQQVLGVVGKDYEIVQNVDAFSFFDSIVGGEGIQYETAGALGKGERIFITAKLPNYIKVGDDDVIEQYLFLTTSHDGYGSITAAFTPVRIVCNNTLNAAMKNHTNSIKIRHTANAKSRLEQAHQLMGITNNLSKDIESTFNQWAKVQITDPELKKLIQVAMAPNKEVLKNLQTGKMDETSTCYKNIIDNVFAYAMSSPTQVMDTTRGTVFGAYNAITGYFQNVRNYKDEEAKLKSLMYGGTGQLRTQAAFNLCDDFAKKGITGLLLN